MAPVDGGETHWGQGELFFLDIGTLIYAPSTAMAKNDPPSLGGRTGHPELTPTPRPVASPLPLSFKRGEEGLGVIG